MVLSSTFAFDATADLARAASDRVDTLYTRWSNPTIDAVEERVAELEGAEGALAVGSGMAAIALALMAASARGGTLLVQREVYGGTHELVEHVLALRGTHVVRAGLDELPRAAAALPPGSTVHVEMPTNPTIRVLDLAALRAASPDDALIVVDATFATPVLLRPLALGADVVVHSATKYLAGHHDVVAGVLAGSAAFVEEAWKLRKLLGPVLDPAAAYRLWRGLETLELRVRRQTESADRLAHRLVEHGAVSRVHYPTLADHPDFATAQRVLPDGAGGVLSFELAGGWDAAARVADGLSCFANAPSLGGVRSLVTWPAGVSHVGLSAAEREAAGVADGLLRLALGIEPLDVLWGDLRSVLDSLPTSQFAPGPLRP